jgi:hypothetical protein
MSPKWLGLEHMCGYLFALTRSTLGVAVELSPDSPVGRTQREALGATGLQQPYLGTGQVRALGLGYLVTGRWSSSGLTSGSGVSCVEYRWSARGRGRRRRR